MLQLLGLGVVALGIRSIRKTFALPSLLESLSQQFKRLFQPARRTVTSELTIAWENEELDAFAQLRVSPDAPIADRVTALENNLAAVLDRLRKHHDRRSKEFALLKADVSAKRAETRADLDHLRNQLEAVTVGGLHLETVGLVWLIVGLILGTLSAEIARLAG